MADMEQTGVGAGNRGGDSMNQHVEDIHGRGIRQLPPSTCETCTVCCRNDICRRWRIWFSHSWQMLQEMFR